MTLLLVHAVCLAQPGSVDASFSVGTGFDGRVYVVKLQPDGKILCGGLFNNYNGTPAHRIVRLNSNGTLDATFNAQNYFGEGLGHEVRTIELQSDGKVIVGGAFAIVAIPFYAALGIARLNSNGSLDMSFQVSMGDPVNTVVVQSDDRIVAGGFFTNHLFMGLPTTTPCKYIVRLLPDGHIDTSFGLFSPDWGFNGAVWRIKMKPDGHFLVGGEFTAFDNGFNFAPTSAYYLATVSSSGSIGSVYPGIPAYGMNGPVYALEMNERTGFCAGGAFSSYDNQSRSMFTRISATTNLNDNSFSVGSGFGPGVGWVFDTYQLPSGSMYVCGWFPGYNGVARPNFVKLQSNGTLVSSFNADFSFFGSVYSIEVQTDGKIIAVGEYQTVGGLSRNGIVRLNGDAPVSAVSLFPQVILEGACPTGAAMQDWLRDASLVPLTEPYTALGYSYVGSGSGGTTTPAVLAVDNAFNSVVDWVVVELRNAGTPSVVTCSRPGLLLQSGLITGTNATSPVVFMVPAGNYHISIRHRNHLGMMTSVPVYMSNQDPENVDFTSAWLGNYGTNAQKNIGGLRMLWMGNAKRDNILKYVGANNDRDQILTRLGGNVSATLNGYYVEDTRMDGVVKYMGTNNDRDPILVNIGGVSTGTRLEQLP